ncbi:CPBP family intramembrane glutamic endopeptidase [Anaeromicropila populeti]|uniref:CAAX prenyl protease 2/Lysostaphin resistance protein A-like domain-containing protein n=1 Tax=Anaeromicropila populeti TaxID=37658 RepID=A0A1I6I583_9FIRM|nr:type II CAAX endopeptidase family protein [Anaeromicropila populeti]SFR61906.1 hypothetical protein SAMN05661086_00425 [Anaeromicropila populeti]
MRKFTTKKVLIALSSIFILIVSQIIALVLVNLLAIIGLPVMIRNIFAGICYAGTALYGISILCKKGLNLSPEECGITKINLKPIWCISAFIMPFAVSGVLLLMPGTWENTPVDLTTIGSTLSRAIVFYGLATGIVEEAVFRGVIMTALELRWNKKAAILLPSMLFGLLHIIGNNLSFVSMIQLLLAGTMVGILLSLVTYESKSIWSSAFIHGIWNTVMIGGILNIGTKANEMSIFNYVLSTKSFLITGGDFGVEASVAAIAAYLLFSMLAYSLWNKNRIK